MERCTVLSFPLSFLLLRLLLVLIIRRLLPQTQWVGEPQDNAVKRGPECKLRLMSPTHAVNMGPHSGNCYGILHARSWADRQGGDRHSFDRLEKVGAASSKRW